MRTSDELALTEHGVFALMVDGKPVVYPMRMGAEDCEPDVYGFKPIGFQPGWIREFTFRGQAVSMRIFGAIHVAKLLDHPGPTFPSLGGPLCISCDFLDGPREGQFLTWTQRADKSEPEDLDGGEAAELGPFHSLFEAIRALRGK